MTEPSDAAKRKACELANAVSDYDWRPTDMAKNAPLLTLALYIDEVDRVARQVIHDAKRGSTNNIGLLENLMLPDPVDPLEEIFDGFAQMVIAKPGVFAATLRAELDKRGLTIAPKEQGRLTDGK